MAGGYVFEVEADRVRAGDGPVVSYEIQISVGLDKETGVRCWRVLTEGVPESEVTHHVGVFRGVYPKSIVRAVKVTTEVIR